MASLDSAAPVREKAGELSDEQAYLATLQELLTCACSWEADARLLGNVRAADMVQALMFAIGLKTQLAERAAEVERLTKALANFRKVFGALAEEGIVT